MPHSAVSHSTTHLMEQAARRIVTFCESLPTGGVQCCRCFIGVRNAATIERASSQMELLSSLSSDTPHSAVGSLTISTIFADTDVGVSLDPEPIG